MRMFCVVWRVREQQAPTAVYLRWGGWRHISSFVRERLMCCPPEEITGREKRSGSTQYWKVHTGSRLGASTYGGITT
ncbi:hypothetical protein, unlikely [Trypanosoma brucei gambiense DAL972]|uniref:Uncharacterized protein n=2 Tax=Trypanosoma brucei TaxID=5691 RepID=C9ZID9_TRYB9|nr:hypothetical protein, unlikely [Trypanosoma brucei gambiense DAL972]RHW74390.1 hypothetical protein DPX39_010022600 [Trypanosoma brucei equiperdum]CBH08931.1 hypothetical protein, unlikely [Trypanosoma brucei gambiense DAL972]|eukprot:XP_011771372.1 hypothetical protein, unlikely [Trypanosoma brucei gambiense DAL972]